MLNRRRFLGLLGGAAVVSAVSAALIPQVSSAVSIVPQVSAIRQYADYVSCSHLATDVCINPCLANLTKELNYRLFLTLENLTRTTNPDFPVIGNYAQA